MRKSILLSGALHAGVLAATVVTWPHMLDSSAEETPMIPVDLVTVAEVNNIAPTVTEPEPPPPEEIPQPPPEAAPPEVPEPEPAPEPEPEPTPEPPPPQQEVVAAPRNPVVPIRRPRPERPPNFDIDSVLAMLDKQAPKPPAPPNARVAAQSQRGIGAQTAMTVDIENALKAQVRECWNMPVGAPNPEQLIVHMRVFLARDGDLAQPPQQMPETRTAAARNRYVAAAADAADRAIRVCAPYRGLPPDRHDQWREIVMTFDPKELLGR